jgi:glycosyltransferase involved in cell wall biosynthesis
MKASWKTSPFLRKIRHLAGFAHYVIPEVISLRRADHVVCVSESLRQEVLENYRLAPERVTVVANGAPLEARALWHAKKAVDRPALIYAGRLHPLKGILPFVESFVERPDIDVPFLILGDGPDMKRIQMLARQDLRIQLPGWVSPAEVRKHLAQTNIFVFPSEREGCPIAVLEAMATGHACVVRDIPVMHELLGEDAGIFCETPGQMLDEVAALATSLERRFELQGLAWERSKVFSWEESAKRLQDVYSLVAERGDSRNGGR